VSERVRIVTTGGVAPPEAGTDPREVCPREGRMAEADKKAIDRRNFLRTVGGASTVAVAAVASPLVATDAEAYDPGQAETKGRYRESDHVKAYYRTNGYETLKK
jgi:hypothetical protein